MKYVARLYLWNPGNSDYAYGGISDSWDPEKKNAEEYRGIGCDLTLRDVKKLYKDLGKILKKRNK